MANHNIKKILKPDAPDKQVLLVSQVSVFVAAAVTLLLALNPPDMLVWLIWAGIGIMYATFAVPLLARIVLEKGDPGRGPRIHGLGIGCITGIWRDLVLQTGKITDAFLVLRICDCGHLHDRRQPDDKTNE